jgi:hypothetical protein
MQRRKPSKAKIAEYWRNIYETHEGRAAIGALMARAGVYSPIVAQDAFTAGVAIGERNMAAWLAEIVGLRPEEYVTERDKVDRVDLLAQFNYET